MFHAIVLERRKFGPLGFNIRYSFTEGDADVGKEQTSLLLEECSAFPRLPPPAHIPPVRLDHSQVLVSRLIVPHLLPLVPNTCTRKLEPDAIPILDAAIPGAGLLCPPCPAPLWP